MRRSETFAARFLRRFIPYALLSWVLILGIGFVQARHVIHEMYVRAASSQSKLLVSSILDPLRTVNYRFVSRQCQYAVDTGEFERLRIFGSANELIHVCGLTETNDLGHFESLLLRAMKVPLEQSFPVLDENNTEWGHIEGTINRRRAVQAAKTTIFTPVLITAGFVFLILGISFNLIMAEGLMLRKLASWVGFKADNVDQMNSEDPSVDIHGLSQEGETISESIRRLIRNITSLKQELRIKSKLAAVGQTVTMFAHDARKPLSTLEIFLREFEAQKGDPKFIQTYLKEVVNSKREIDRMIEELLRFGREQKLTLEPCDPRSLMASALRETARFCRDADIDFIYRLNHTGVFVVDVVEAKRIFNNIVTNAFEAVGKKGTIWFETCDSMMNGRSVIEVSIGNTGKSIEPDELHKVFEPFYTRGKKGGTGLGLAISYQIVASHGGSIGVESDRDRGTVFTFTLPSEAKTEDREPMDLVRSSRDLATHPEKSNGDATTDQADINAIRGARYPINLLIVDDEPLFRRSLRSMLDGVPEVKGRVTVVEASSGEEALELFDRTRFDVVITDVAMGEGRLDGFEFTRKVLERYPQKGVLLHSNLALLDGKARAREVGAVDFLPKPMSQRELLRFLACSVVSIDEAKAKSVIRVGILDDNVLMREGYASVVRRVIANFAHTCEIRTFDQSRNVLAYMEATPAEILFLDLHLGPDEPDGLALAHRLRDRFPQTKLVLVTNENQCNLENARSEGAVDLILQAPLTEGTAREALDSILKIRRVESHSADA